MNRPILLALATGFFLLGPSVRAQTGEATFEGVGDLPGGSFSSTVYGVSGDGAVVVGYATPSSGVVAFRWEGGTMDSLGFLPGAPFNSSMAFGASEDGSVIAGQSNSAEGFRAFRWEDGVMTDLGVLSGDSGSGVYGLSDDGAVAVGFSNGPEGLEAVRWEAGEIEGLGHLSGGVNSNARAVSADGSVVVGQSDREGFNVEEAFRWEDGTMEGLGYLAETAFTSWAYDVTPNGSIVVGLSQSDYGGGGEGGDEAFLWSAAADSMVGLGDLPGGFLSSWAHGVSADGSVVVGQSSTEDEEGNPFTEAFIWTQEEGMRSLKEVLETEYGLDLTGWTLFEAVAVSNDGTVIVGNGTNPDGNNEGWRAVLPPSSGEGTRYVNASTGSDTSDCTDPANPCATIGFAIDQAVAGDSIQVADGAYTESITIDKDLALHGESMAGTIIQAHAQPGQADSRVITNSSSPEVAIGGLTIRHGRALGASDPEGSGGGLYNDGGSLSLIDVAFENNEAELNGGGLFNTNSSPTVTGVVFTNNVAQAVCSGCGGGGIYNDSDLITLDDVTFEGNTTMSNGGGLLVAGAAALTHATFNNNQAGLGGGGMYTTLTSSSADLTDVTFTENTASGSGGGLVIGGTATLTHVTFNSNEAGTGGGVFGAAFSSSVLTDVAFTDNSAGSGGGMDIRPSSTSILTDVEFTGNSAEAGAGGGILVQPKSFSTLTNVTFTENIAHDGGGMFSFGGSSVLTNVAFSGNEVEGRGGGFHRFGGSTTIFSNATFIQNAAGLDGGGIWTAAPDADLTLTNVILWQNEAGDAGGGIYNAVGSVTATNLTVSENVAARDGGGIYHIGASSDTLSLTNTIVWGNSAVEEGNEVYNFGGSLIALFYSLYDNEPGDIVENGGFEAENSLTEDPLFVDADNGDLHLTETSPAIDAGDPDTDLALFPVNDDGDPIDLGGNPRVFGDGIDIGAYEHQGIIADEASPEEIADGLSAPRPNPARGSTVLTVQAAETQHVTVEVFDVTGRRLQTLYDGALAAGANETLSFDATALPVGVYVIRAMGESFTETRRVTVVR